MEELEKHESAKVCDCSTENSSVVQFIPHCPAVQSKKLRGRTAVLTHDKKWAKNWNKMYEEMNLFHFFQPVHTKNRSCSLLSFDEKSCLNYFFWEFSYIFYSSSFHLDSFIIGLFRTKIGFGREWMEILSVTCRIFFLPRQESDF